MQLRNLLEVNDVPLYTKGGTGFTTTLAHEFRTLHVRVGVVMQVFEAYEST